MFKYPDFYSIYSQCSNNYYTNILYQSLFCSLNTITGQNFSHQSIIFITIASIINMSLLIGYFEVFQKYLNTRGKYLFIILLAFHPYLGIYFFRFYTDLFASIGIFLMIYYIMNNKKIDMFFIISALILMNFRVALIPVFFIYALFNIFRSLKQNSPFLIPLTLLIFSITSLFLTLDFSMNFVQINSKIPLLEKIFFNILFLLGFREAYTGLFRELYWGEGPLESLIDSSAMFIMGYTLIDYIILGSSLILICIHFIGLYGVLRFSAKKRFNLLLPFTYVLIPIVSISSMRYLMPLIPVLLFGFSYYFTKFNKKNN